VQAPERHPRLKNIGHHCLGRGVKHSFQRALVFRHVADVDISSVSGSHDEDARFVAELLKEVFTDRIGQTDSNSIETIQGNSILGPADEGVADKLVVLVEVRVAFNPTDFDLVLVHPVIDLTGIVIVGSIVKGN